MDGLPNISLSLITQLHASEQKLLSKYYIYSYNLADSCTFFSMFSFFVSLSTTLMTLFFFFFGECVVVGKTELYSACKLNQLILISILYGMTLQLLFAGLWAKL